MSSPTGASSGKEAPSLPTPWGPPDTAQRSPGSLCLLGEVFATHVSLPSPQPYPRKPKPRCPSSASPAAFPALCPPLSALQSWGCAGAAWHPPGSALGPWV